MRRKLTTHFDRGCTNFLNFLLLVLSIAWVGCSLAADTNQVNDQANLVLREKISSVDSHEALIADVVIPAGASMPRHQHPGDEFLYMLQGQVMLAQDGRDTIVLTAGQAYRITAGTIHAPQAGAQGARAIVFRVHPEGEVVTNIVED